MNSRLKWLGVAVIFVATLIAYQPSLSIGFWTDDFWYVEMVGRLSVPDYLRSYFDPSLQWRWYRPMQGVQWWLEYAFLRGEPVGYHLIQILLHATGISLLYLLTVRVTRRLSVGLVAAFLYLTISAYAIAVFQPSVVDPLLAPFYLSTILFWLEYLDRGGAWRYVLTMSAFVAALMTKEVAATLPITLVLTELWLIQKPFALLPWVKRYALFFLILIPYALFELRALSQGVFTQQLGYGPGLHILSTLAFHLTMLTFAWSSPADANWVLVLIVVAAMVYFFVKRQGHVLFVASAILLTLLPILPFPPGLARNARYLYLPFMGSAIIFALLIERAVRAARRVGVHVLTPVACIVIALVMVGSNAAIADAADSFGGTARANRLLFRPIYTKYSSFPPGTFLYFLVPRYPNVSGVMFLRYGKQVTVSGTDTDGVAGLRAHPAAYVFFFDDENAWQDQAVSKNVNARARPALPVRFADAVQAEGLELVSDQIRRGDALITIVYWRAQKKMNRDYTVFAHLVDHAGRIIASVDRQPQEGRKPTSSWSSGARIPDGVVVAIPKDASLGNDFRLEIGLYDSGTFERLPVLGADGQEIEDKIMISPIQIIE